jgi:PhoPQ-activated pathogenicity-related protein
MKYSTRLLLIITMTLTVTSFTYANLIDYVKSDDTAYKWEKISHKRLDAHTLAFRLKLTSQKWQNIIWEHIIDIIIPTNSIHTSTFVYFFITGTNNKDRAIERGREMAHKINAPVVILHDIPNQPLFNNLWEDDLIAFTFLKYLETQDNTWPLIFAMVKAAVKAMDAVEEVLRSDSNTAVKGFVVSGSSKRGWTAWLTAAADQRIKGIIPIVYDNLNMKKQMKHQLDSWKNYSDEISEYKGRSLPQRLLDGEKKVEKLAHLVDPFAYHNKITVPKLIVIGTNDPYWPLDALNLYYPDLLGEKYIHYVPNEGHQISLLKGELRDETFDTMAAFFEKVEGILELPEFTGKVTEQRQKTIFTMKSTLQPHSVRVWKTHSSTRDFRNSRWKDYHLKTQRQTYTFEAIKPRVGFIAYFGEATYLIKGKKIILSTPVTIFSPQGEVKAQ